MNLENYTQKDIFKQTYQKQYGASADHNMIAPSNNHIPRSCGENVQHNFNAYTNNFGTTVGK